MELDERFAPWLMGIVTLLICVACYYQMTGEHFARAILLGVIGVAINFLIASHVWDNR